MEIGGKLCCDKETAGKAIIDACTKMNTDEPVALGRYRGFSLLLVYDPFANEYRVNLKGSLSHPVVLGKDVFGNITRLDNALANLPDSLAARQAELEETRRQMENARAEMAAPFAKEAELAEKTARLQELNILLNMDEKDHTLIDDTPEEGDAVPVKRSVELER